MGYIEITHVVTLRTQTLVTFANFRCELWITAVTAPYRWHSEKGGCGLFTASPNPAARGEDGDRGGVPIQGGLRPSSSYYKRAARDGEPAEAERELNSTHNVQ